MRRLTGLALTALVAGCGGGGSPGVPAPASSAASGGAPRSASVAFTLHWPRYLSPSSARRPEFVSPSTLSATFAVNGQTAVTENAPTTGSLTTTITVPAPAGTDTFAIALFDSVNGGGNLLGKVSVGQTIVAGVLNTVNATVNGQLARIGISPGSPFVEGNQASGFTLVGDQALPIALLPEDADGNVILMPGAIPALALATTGSAVTMSPGLGVNAFVLQATAPATAVPFTASGKNLDGATVTASFTVAALAALYIAQYRTQQILVYDENGAQIVLPLAQFAGAANPQGVTFVPGASPGTGRLVVTDATDSKIFEYDEAGNALSPGGAAFAGLDQPFFATYDSTTGALLVPQYNDDAVLGYGPSGNAVSPGPFAGLSQPISATYDPHANATFVVNFGPATIAKFDGAGAPLVTGTAAPSGGSHPMGSTFDSNNDEIYVADAGYPIVEIPEGGPPEPSTVNAFSEADAAISNIGGGTTSFTGLTYATDLVFDPFLKELFVTDAGANATFAFTEAGGSVTPSAPSPFAGQSEPEGIAFVP